jgi:hypothetical protein
MGLPQHERHTALVLRKDETECPLYGQEGSKRSEGRAVRPTWRTTKDIQSNQDIVVPLVGELLGDIVPPPVSPSGFYSLRASSLYRTRAGHVFSGAVHIGACRLMQSYPCAGRRIALAPHMIQVDCDTMLK